MQKKTINLIIALMSISLLGLTIIQLIWLNRSIGLKADNFNDRVTFAINRVRILLEEDANSLETYENFFNQSTSSLFKIDKDPLTELLKPNYKYTSEILKNQLGNTAWRIRPDIALNTVSTSDLTKYLKLELGREKISLRYEYGVFSNETKGYIIMNGHHMVDIGNVDQSSNGGELKNLNRSSYQVPLFSVDENKSAGSLRLFFPAKTTFLLSTIFPSLLSSFIFTGLVLFCFIYTISIILRQKKISIMKTDFINNMTHEFKTPIATISLAADSINNPIVLGKPKQIQRYAHIIKQENTRMLSQVEKVLQIARLDKKDFQLKITSVNLNEIINQAVEYSVLKVNKEGGIIKTVLNAVNPVIMGDENHLSNIIHNLLDNASKYSPDKPNITMETKNRLGGVELKVTDQGMGMSKEDVKRIFEKFYRVTTGNIHDVKGFGLGLSYVKAIMDAHKGKISVESELGKGSEFVLFFPQTHLT